MRFYIFLRACAFALVAAMVILVVIPAFAQTTTPAAPVGAVVPFGDWIDGVAQFLLPILGVAIAGLVTFILRFVPAAIRTYITAGMIAQVNQLLQNAVNYAITTVDGAEKGKTLTIPVANAVIAQALQFVIDHGPSALIDWMGGKIGITQKIVARLPPTEAAVSAATLPTAATAAVK